MPEVAQSGYFENVLVYSLIIFLIAGIIAFASTPLIKTFAYKVGAIDVPKDSRRMHNVPIPRLGGLAIFLGFIFSMLLLGPLDGQMRGILIGAVIIVVLGVIDDIVPLKAWIKLIVQIIAALVPVLNGVVIERISNFNMFSNEAYINLGVLAIPVTVMWIVGITNSVNLIDGLDGLAVGVSSIASISMFVVATLVSEPATAVVMAALAGSCIGFLPYNMNPAKIFMGDTGATFLGFILATVSIQGLFKFYAIISFAVPFLIMGLPIFDTLFTIVRRIARKQSPMHADRGHVHHRLIDMGFNQKQSVAILYTISALLGVTAVVLTTSGELKAMILIAAIIVCVLAGVQILKMASEHQAKIEAEKEHTENAGNKTDDAAEDNAAGESGNAENTADPAGQNEKES